MKELYMIGSNCGIDIIHSFYFPIGMIKGQKTILTIHDLAAIKNPDWFPGRDTFDLFNGCLRKVIKEINHIIAVSNATKLDIQNIYEVDEEKISVIYNGLYRESKLDERNRYVDVRKKYKINGEYILSVCTIEPRKNLISLLRAFEIYKERKTTKLQLVVCGASGWKNSDVYQQASNSKYRDDIIFTNFVSDMDLDRLYEEALLVSYISYYEGFGLPVLEALDKGKAVITSNLSSMPEVGGDAVCYIDPYNIEEIADAIQRLAEDDLYRQHLEALAPGQAANFSYKKAAKETIEIYKRVGCMYE